MLLAVIPPLPALLLLLTLVSELAGGGAGPLIDTLVLKSIARKEVTPPPSS